MQGKTQKNEKKLWERRLTVGMAVAIVATTAALAPAITPSVYPLKKKKKGSYISSAYNIDQIFLQYYAKKVKNKKTKHWRDYEILKS